MINDPSFKGAMARSLDSVIDANKISYGKHFIEVCKEHLYTLQTGIYFQQNSYLVATVNVVIADIVQNGLISYWENDLMNEKYLSRPPITKDPKKLEFHQLSGGFFILIMGLILSLIIFLMELILNKFKSFNSLF